jgi:hypothetical protein
LVFDPLLGCLVLASLCPEISESLRSLRPLRFFFMPYPGTSSHFSTPTQFTVL